MRLVKRVILSEGEPVVWVGVHAVKWQSHWGEPSVGFTHLEEDEQSLIDAAPQLLEACEKALKFTSSMDWWVGGKKSTTTERLEAAIAAAKGGE